MFQHYARSSAKALLRRSRFRGFLLTITPVEAIHAAGSIDQLLLARKKRMAGGTDFNMEIAFTGRACLERLAAGAGHSYFFIFRVNSRFHFLYHLYSSRLVASFKHAMIRVATALRQAGDRWQQALPHQAIACRFAT